MIAGAPHFQACRQFCADLVVSNTYVYFAQVVRLELPQGLRRLATTKTNLPQAVREQWRLDHWSADATVRHAWLAFGLREFDELLARFREAFELPWQRSTWLASIQIMGHTGLQAIDATLIAAAGEADVQDFAAVDDDFRKVPWVQFWSVRNP
jgi:predicted nucleic acid-binding protein